jgi:hypothetical protein
MDPGAGAGFPNRVRPVGDVASLTPSASTALRHQPLSPLFTGFSRDRAATCEDNRQWEELRYRVNIEALVQAILDTAPPTLTHEAFTGSSREATEVE